MAERNLSKPDRLAEFYRRLAAAPVCSDFAQAYRLICVTLDAVEDELTDIPNSPANWMTDGRMYPPQMDRLYEVPGRPDLKRFGSVGHSTIIGANGAIVIRLPTGKVVFEKAGADGRGLG